MNFRTNRINKKIRRPKISEITNPTKSKNQSLQKLKNKFTLHKFINKYTAIAILVLFISTSLFAIYKYTPAKTIVTTNILKTIGSDLEQDKDGYTNILAIGVGGEGHEGGSLTDTLIVASINEKTDKVIMTSVPRDLYVSHENIISQRINSVYENTSYRLGENLGLATLSDIIGEFLGMPIHYYVKIDFKGLVEIVDSVGGIEVYNEENIYDPYYPGPNYSYETFTLAQGMHHLDGQTALKFARSRKTSSDFARSNRQQQVIFALKEKALQLGVLTSPETLQNLFNSIQNNISTNLTIREITSLAAVGSDLKSSDLNSIVIHDDPNIKGGFLYTPPREQYRNAFVLLPTDKSLSQIHRFVQLHRSFPDLMKTQTPVDVLNGTKTSGLAGNTALILQRFGFATNQIKNIENRDIEVEESFIETSIGKDSELISALQLLFPSLKKLEFTDPVLPDPTKDELPSSIRVIAGKNFIQILPEYNISANIDTLTP